MDKEKLGKIEAPKCDLRWDSDHFVVECESTEDRDRAAKALEEGEIVVKVRVKKEAEDTKR